MIIAIPGYRKKVSNRNTYIDEFRADIIDILKQQQVDIPPADPINEEEFIHQRDRHNKANR